jgi:hypothetical protein
MPALCIGKREPPPEPEPVPVFHPSPTIPTDPARLRAMANAHEAIAETYRKLAQDLDTMNALDPEHGSE